MFRETLDRSGGGRIIALDMSPLASAGHFADAFHQVPRCDDPDFLAVTQDICRAEEADLLIPLIDTELPAMAAARTRLAAGGTLAMVSGPETIQLCHDKAALGRLLEDCGVPVPEMVTDLGELASHGWSGEVVVKPRFGSSSIGLRFVMAAEASLDPDLNLEEFVVQRRVKGPEFSVDLFVDERGAVRSAFVREQLEFRAGETSKGRSVTNDSVREAAVAAVSALPDPFGLIHADVILDKDSGVPRVLELNARFPGGFPLSHRAGSPAISWLLALASGVTPDYDERFVQPVVMSRYELGVYTDESGHLLE